MKIREFVLNKGIPREKKFFRKIRKNHGKQKSFASVNRFCSLFHKKIHVSSDHITFTCFTIPNSNDYHFAADLRILVGEGNVIKCSSYLS